MTKLTKHEEYLLTLVEAARIRHPKKDRFLAWLRGFTRPASLRPVFRDRLKKFME